MSPARFFIFSPRVLDPGVRLGEILFGLIMTLTFTLGAGLMIEHEGREGARQLLIALIGCNVAWGIIDGMMYLVNQLFDRGRMRLLGRSLRRAPSVGHALQLIGAELDELLGDVLNAAERARLYLRIAENVRARPERSDFIRAADLLGSLASFWLVFVASLPAAIPFLFIDDARMALRASNAILLALLFATGYGFAQHTLGHPWLVGLGLLALGLTLVAVAIALGG